MRDRAGIALTAAPGLASRADPAEYRLAASVPFAHASLARSTA